MPKLGCLMSSKIVCPRLVKRIGSVMTAVIYRLNSWDVKTLATLKARQWEVVIIHCVCN